MYITSIIDIIDLVKKFKKDCIFILRKEERKKRQKRKKRSLSIVIGLLVIFSLVVMVTVLTLSIFREENVYKKNNVAKDNKSSASFVSDTSSTFAEKETTKSTTNESTAKTSDSTSHLLDDSELLANASELSYGVYYFKDEDYISNNNDDSMISASVIKIFIMDYIYEKNVSGQVATSGESLGNLCQRMIQSSDNAATNTIIDSLGMDTLNSFFISSGYSATCLERKMLDEQARSAGKENYTSLTDTMTFLKKMYKNKDSAPYSTMLELMMGQQIRTKIPSKLPAGTLVANKTGELSSVENDVGLVLDQNQPFAIVVLSNGVSDTESMRSAIGNFTLLAMKK